ncbi:MAG: DEAD/DEAH box helicase, partial [bacterium]
MSCAPEPLAGAVARVVLVPAPGRLAPLDYRTPQRLAPGTRVLVPLGTRRAMGIVIGAGAAPEGVALRDVIAVLDDAPVLDASLMQLAEWMAGYYLASLAEVLGTALPGALRIETERRVQLVGMPPDGLAAPELAVVALLAGGDVNTTVVVQRLGEPGRRALAALQRRGVVMVAERLRRETAPTRRQRFYEALPVDDAHPSLARRPALRAMHAYLRAHPLGRAPDHELRHSFPDAAAKLRTLTAAGVVRVREEEQYRTVLPPVSAPDTRVALTAAQQTAVDAIAAARGEGFVAWLLHGVTGSGKTEVYLRAIAALPADAGALVLVPEISLTHQLVERIRARFGDAVAVLHSQLSAGERWDEWRRIARGEARIV